MITTNRLIGHLVILLGLSAAAGCSGLLDITNPGGTQDEGLNDDSAIPALVTGMSADLSVALARTAVWGSVWSDDLSHSGTLGAPSVFARGQIPADQINGWWAEAHRARWTAEDGIRRIRKILGDGYDSSADAARANVLAGFANRLLGEHVCSAVIDGGPVEAHTVHLTRAESQFTEAIRIASAIGDQTLIRAATAGRASVRVLLDDWTGAQADAAQVPITFRYDALYSTNTTRENNGWPGPTRMRGEYTVWGSPAAEITGDPRVPWEPALDGSGAQAMGANGHTPWFRQGKFLDDGDEIALVRGTEMLLIRAEAALRANDVPGAVGLINQVRGQADQQPITASTAAEAWPLLQRERGIVLWLEGRRFGDLRRWNEATGPAHHPFLNDRDRCVPISADEAASNANVRG